LRLTVNQEERDFTGDLRIALVDVLRDHLRLTGTKAVCREGFCGACLVHVNGEPIASCLVPVGALDGAAVTTIEGIAGPDRLSLVQQALADHDVVQCGMCFPGMVMSLTAFLRTNGSPSREEVKAAMTGNICRCTGYERIIDAILSIERNTAARHV
jgi:carbon-monoxide dehydrogenase small subunit